MKSPKIPGTMISMDVDLARVRKAEIREEIRAQRTAMTQAEVETARDQLTEQLKSLALARDSQSISCYFPVRNEPDTTPFVKWARENGIRVLVPSCREDLLLDWIEVRSDETMPGRFGLPEPAGPVFSPIEVSSVDLMLVPASAVDRNGVRLGWGGGFFDRTLGSMDGRPPVFAVLHDGEIYDEIPSELHDTPVTGAVLPSGVEHLDHLRLEETV